MRFPRIFLLTLPALICWSIQGVSAEEDIHVQRARECLEVLQLWYDEETGQWRTTSWWNAANALTAIVHYTQLSGDSDFAGVVANTFDRCREFVVDDDPQRPPWVCRNFVNAWYDDEGWWVLVWLDAFDLTGQRRYLEMARTTFADMTRGWDNVCRGGVYWKKPNIGKHTITNGLFLLAALRLHQRGGGQAGGRTYQQWALDTWRWMQNEKLINDQHEVENGLDDACRLETGNLYTYNQGVVVGALIELSQVTGDPAKLELAERIADATMANLVDADGILRDPKEPEVTGDSAQFKGVFMRHLARLYQVTGEERYRDFILHNAETMWGVARNADTGEIGALWNGSFDAGDAARQSSALDALNAAIAVTRD